MVFSLLLVGVILFNHSDVDFQVKVGDRIAQLILERIAIADVEEITEGELPTTSVEEGGGDLCWNSIKTNGVTRYLILSSSLFSCLLATCLFFVLLVSVRGEGGFGSTGVSNGISSAAAAAAGSSASSATSSPNKRKAPSSSAEIPSESNN